MTDTTPGSTSTAEISASGNGSANASAAPSAKRTTNGNGSGAAKEVRQVERVVIRFAGDSGDGMQLTGERFTSETAAFGNDLSTLPDFPAEIRAPASSPAGVSGFQLHFSDHDI